MHIAILTLEGFNELDSFIALGVLNRIKSPDWRVTLGCPEPVVTSMNGVVVHAQSSLAEVAQADAVIIGSGIKTREVVADESIMALRRPVLRPGSLLGPRGSRRPGPHCTASRRLARRMSTSSGP